MYKQSKRGFTLVELLVVIGIIALLISILLPTLGKAREAGMRAKCLSNLHQMHLAFTIYADQNKDQVPLCWGGGTHKQYNYIVWDGVYGGGYAVTFGNLFSSKVLNNPQSFYCPSQDNPSWSFNGSDNAWKPGVNLVQVRSSYGCRPVAESGAVNNKTSSYPRLSKMKNLAIFADVVSVSANVDQGHKKGVNVLYGNGGAKWVDRPVFNANLLQCQTNFDQTNPDVVLKPDPAGLPGVAIGGVWYDLDRGTAPSTIITGGTGR